MINWKLVDKTKRVIESCKTRDQYLNTRTYVDYVMQKMYNSRLLRKGMLERGTKYTPDFILINDYFSELLNRKNSSLRI